MEPDVIRMFSSSPPPMEDGAEDEDDEFGDFGTFSGVPNSISFSELDTPTTFNQSQALTATSPPELLCNRGVVGLNHRPGIELSKANGVAPVGRQSSGPSERTEMKSLVSDCNGEGQEGLTNGFVSFDVQGSPPSQNSIHFHIKDMSTEDTGSVPGNDLVDDFADFAAFSSSDGHVDRTEDMDEDKHLPTGESDQHCSTEQGTASEDHVRDTDRTGADPSGSDSPGVAAEAPDDSCDGGPQTDSLQRDEACPPQGSALDGVYMNYSLTLNGMDGSEEAVDCDELSPDAAADSEAGPVDEKGSETETETSFGRPLSTDALEEYGDISTTGSAPSPPLQSDTATPAEDDEDFGDFGDAGSFGGQGFADFEVQQDQTSDPVPEAANMDQDDDFGDFNSPRFHSAGAGGEDGGTFASFPVSDSFGNFSSAEGGEAGWSAFGDQQEVEEESWAAFSAEPSVAPPEESREEEEEEQEEDEALAVGEETGRTEKQPALLTRHLEKLFHSSFPPAAAQRLENQVVSLEILLEPAEEKPEVGAEEERSPCHRSGRGGVWTQLQDIHEALGLRYQWGGSHCNKALLCCLGIDTRNILFTGQKKQPVIVPMYAAGLGMLEPTKEPVKPVSAAEMIASIAQTPPAAPEKNSCSSDSVQEALPPIQFDWSSSGLTNPLDGVDPELFELTTAKLDVSGSGSRVADAFARLMSTMEKTSTSTRKPKKDENLSEEAAKVIAALPDLSFMQAKVLMFPATLTPLHSQATPD